MKLEGSLDAFSLPDIFQLLSYTKKTGGLRLQHADERGVVYFADGAVTGASAEGGRQALARRLIGLGLVDDAALTSAVAAAVATGETERGGGVVAALVASGAVDVEDVVPVATDHLHDAVFELLRWPSGDFAFAVDEKNPDDVGLRLASEEVVTHASEQRSRWGSAATVVPSPESVPVLVGSSADSTPVLATDWPVLRLVDGRRRVSEIVDLLGGVLLTTVLTLADLVERGLVEIRTADAVDPVSGIQRRMDLLASAETGHPAVADPTGAPAVAPAPEPAPAAAAVAAVVSAPAVAPAPVVHAVPEPVAPAASTVVTVPEATDPDDPAGPSASQPRLGGAHVPGDVVPPRAEPFLAARQPDFAEPAESTLRTAPPRAAVGATVGNTAVAMAPAGDSLIERDPSVNRSLLLRLIAGVRGL